MVRRVLFVSRQKKGNMQVTAMVMSERADSYVGKKGVVNQQLLNLMDRTVNGERLVQPMEYALSDDEIKQYAGKLSDKTVVIGIREIMPFGGRLRIRGKLVEVLK